MLHTAGVKFNVQTKTSLYLNKKLNKAEVTILGETERDINKARLEVMRCHMVPYSRASYGIREWAMGERERNIPQVSGI